MEISELVIQGLRGFNGVVRLPIAPSITVVVPSSDEQGGVIFSVLQDLLEPPGAEPSQQHLVDPSSTSCRVGTTLVGRSGESFRILRDLQSGKTSLLKQENEQMTTVTERASEISQVVTSQVGFPQVDVLRRLFWTRREDLPSQRTDLVAEVVETTQTNAPFDPKSMRSGSGPHIAAPEKKSMRSLAPGFGSEDNSMDEFAHLSDDEKRAKLEEVKHQLAQKDSVQELEFELDGLQKKGFDLEEKLRPLEDLRFQLQQAEERAASVGDVKEVPEDFRKTVNQHINLKNQHTAGQQELERKIEKMQEQFALTAPASRGASAVFAEAINEPMLKFGLAAGVGFTLLGIVGALAFEPLRNAAYGNIIGFFVALVGGWKVVAEFEHVGRTRGQAMRLQKDFDRAQSRFELDESSFGSMLARYGLKSDDLSALDEVLARAEEAKEAKTLIHDAELALKEAEAEVPADVQEEKNRISTRLKELEDQLYKAGGFMGAPAELNAQIRALEASLSGQDTPSPPADDSFDFMNSMEPGLSSEGAAVKDTSAPHQTFDDVTRELLDAGSDIFFTDLDAVASMVEGRVGQMLSGLTDQRYTKILFHPRGRIGLVEAMSGQEVGFKDLPPGDKDLLYLALKLSILESYVKKTRMPVFFDSVFDGFPDARDTLHGRILQFLGNLTQVICITKKPALMAISAQRLEI
ncbi:MAG: hypothetical protein GY822_19795 [Deltaproteobacteria bacterium]|nr:hypothetical protein [Deltaproteobacteria bacterium]